MSLTDPKPQTLPDAETEFSWRQAVLTYSRPRVLAMVPLGFAAGLPFLLVFTTLTAWLTEGGVSRSTIGFFAWVGITYSIKFVWSPVVDALQIPWLTRILGQRRSWIFIGQAGIAIGLVAMTLAGPGHLVALSFCALLVAFSSATQDVAVDAYRIEAVIPEYQGAMAATYILGYRIALLVAGAGAFYLAEFYSWEVAYWSMAALMLVGITTVLAVSEPDVERKRAFADNIDGMSLRVIARWFRGAVIEPFLEFFHRHGRLALVILLFISVFRVSDIVMGIMATPFYLDMGYTKLEIANVAKFMGFFMSITGSFLGGVLVVKWGIFRTLLLGAIAVAVTNLLFALLSQAEPSITWLALVISADNISGGLAATAFVAYLSQLVNKSYTATQYALFSSLMTLPGKFVSGFSGLVVDGEGYFTYFIVAAALGIPAILLVIWMMRHPAFRLPSQKAAD